MRYLSTSRTRGAEKIREIYDPVPVLLIISKLTSPLLFYPDQVAPRICLKTANRID
jgi:hypothetical protein